MRYQWIYHQPPSKRISIRTEFPRCHVAISHWLFYTWQYSTGPSPSTIPQHDILIFSHRPSKKIPIFESENRTLTRIFILDRRIDLSQIQRPRLTPVLRCRNSLVLVSLHSLHYKQNIYIYIAIYVYICSNRFGLSKFKLNLDAAVPLLLSE